MKPSHLIYLLCFFPISMFAQAPQAFNYQGVARDLNGSPLSNQSISIKTSILEDSLQGGPVYSEIHQTTTNNLGLFALQIGRGTSTSGNFSTLDWGNGSHSLQIEMDESGGNSYQLLGSNQLLSVPYALYAENGSKWSDSQLNTGIQYDQTVIVGPDHAGQASLIINNMRPTIGPFTNTILAGLSRDFNGSKAEFGIYGYPDTDQVYAHLRKSIMLYATTDADDMVLCANNANGSIRFVTDDWFSADNERARITNRGLGIGTTDPKEKLHVADGDVYIEDINKGVIMKSPNGQCWRMTVSDAGEPVFNSVACPN